MPKHRPKYKTVNLLPEKHDELAETAEQLSQDEGAKVTVPQLIYRMHKQFKQQRDKSDEQA